MYSQNFVLHMFNKANELIDIERNKRFRAHDKLDYNLKRMLDHLPEELKELNVGEFLEQYEGDLERAANHLVKPKASEGDERMYLSPPKGNNKKRRNIKKKSQEV